MGDRTSIEWTKPPGYIGATWNPIRAKDVAAPRSGHFCLKVSPGCDHCYASAMQPMRFHRPEYPSISGPTLQQAHAMVYDHTIQLDRTTLLQPARWRKPRTAFLNSMSDTFGEWVLTVWIDLIFAVMALTPRHTYQVLTKRANRLALYMREPSTRWRIEQQARWLQTTYPQHFPELRGELPWPLRNVWLGVTVESDDYAWRAKVLASLPAVVRFVSAEPLLGPLPSLPLLCHQDTEQPINWIIVGGESGPDARPLDLDVARELRDRCQAFKVAYFLKQIGGRTPHAGGRLLDGREYNEYPEVRYVAAV